MQKGDKVTLTEHVIAYDSQGAEYLLPGTAGTILEIHDDIAEFETNKGTYTIPIASLSFTREKAA